MNKCPKCGTQYTGKFCPNGCDSPYAQNQKKKNKPAKVILITLGSVAGAIALLLLIVFVCCVISAANDTFAPEHNNTTTVQQFVTENKSTKEIKKSTSETQKITELITKAPTTKSETLGQINAVKKAKSYLNYTAFSHDGLVEQLEYEKFSHEEAVYGAEHCGADWNEQAAKKAKSYLEFSSFSRDELIEQLEYEKFTHEQAVYGVKAVGY